MTFVEASRAYVEAAGELPVSVTVLIEGEEVARRASVRSSMRIAASSRRISRWSATPAWSIRAPVVTTRLRGLVHEEVTVTGPSIDLHSGMYGGPAINLDQGRPDHRRSHRRRGAG